MGERDVQLMTERARQALPMRRLLEQNGSGPRDAKEKWNSFKCPFCGHKSATVFRPAQARDEAELFKCFHVPCPTNGDAMNEAQLVGQFAGANARDGWKLWLQQAGVWKEERLPTSVLPGSRRRRSADVQAAVTASSPDEAPVEALLPEAIALIRGEGKASISLLQRRMKLSYNRASRVMEELERRGIVGPARDAAPREILLDEEGNVKSGSPSEPLQSNDPSNDTFDRSGSLEAPNGSKPDSEYRTPDNNQGESIGPVVSRPPAAEASAQAEDCTTAKSSEEISAPEHPQPEEGRTPPQGTGPEAAPSHSGSISEGETSNENTTGTEAGREGDGAGDREGSSAGAMAGDGAAADPAGAGLGAGSGGVGGGGANSGGDRGADDGAAGSAQGAGNGRGHGGGGGSGYGSGDARALMALREFYEAIALHPEDRLILLRKRGLLPGAALALGLRSSRSENRAVLKELGLKWGDETMARAGLFRRNPDGLGYGPSAKFCGWGIIGKKPKARMEAEEEEHDPEDESEMEQGWCNPILIPYWSESGTLMRLRPHKDYVKGQGVHLYVARRAPGKAAEGADARTRETVVITEGEFKAAALFQVFKDAYGVAAIPGISTAKKETMQREIGHYLRSVDAKRVIVAYDNEEKGDPNLASYKEDTRKRYDTEVWARYLAGWLKREGYEATVAWLPAEWRDAKGKADWDGVLAARLGEEMRRVEASGELGERPEEGLLGRKAWERIGAAVRKDFAEVLNNGHAPDEHPPLFDSQKERIIKNKLLRIRYGRKLPYGGSAEWKLAEAMYRLARDREFDYAPRARALAEAFRGVQRNYYRRMPTKFGEKDRKDYEKRRRLAEERAIETGNWDEHTFFDELIKGFPEPIADFRLDCRFTLVKGGGDDRDRMVVLSNHMGKSGLVALDAKSFTAPRDFKHWTTQKGPFHFNAGERELEALREDTDNLSAYLEVFELTWFGWHAKPKLWVAADCAITPDGQFLLPDQDGVFWWAESGYLMGKADSEGEQFKQKPPRWHPEKVLAFKEADKLGTGVTNYRWMPRRNGEIGAEPEVVKDLFQELGQALCQTQGCREGYLLLGQMLAFGAAPEFFAREGFFNGIWLSGQRGSGKTTLARVLMGIWGMEMDAGQNMQQCSRVGMQIIAQQFCNLPVWYEEYKNTLEPPKIEFIKSLYNREASAKKEFGGVSREIRTNAIVVGEHSSLDSATRQRFPHVNVAAEKRKGDCKRWFQGNYQFFFSLGRHVLQHRKRYVELFDKHYEAWSKDPAVQEADDRSREVHGVAYAGYMAMAELVGAASETEEREFRKEVAAMTMVAVKDAKETVNINLFWQILITGWRAGAFERGERAKQYFKAQKRTAPGGHPPGKPTQGPAMDPNRVNMKPWQSYHLFIDPNAVVAKLKEYLRKLGQEFPLSIRDLREQLSKEPYWVPGGKDGWKQRMGSGRAATRVWCIDLDRHKEFGYLECEDEELFQSREGVPSTEWVDPRLGELYQIAFEVERDELGEGE